VRMEEILKLKTQVRLEKETVQQKEIEISRLHGQVFFAVFLIRIRIMFLGLPVPDPCLIKQKKGKTLTHIVL
jgi:hypothetical protein